MSRTVLYSMQSSGNCYKPRLLMAQLGIPFELRQVNSQSGETRQPEFLAVNPHGMVPALQLEDNRMLYESNAMLVYLASGTSYLPENRYEHARVMQWLFWEQYSHEPFVAVARSWWSLRPGGREEKAAEFSAWHERGHAALSTMDKHLKDNDFLVGDRYSIADISLYAYTHVAEEGGFDMSPYGGIARWVDRVRNMAGHVTIDWQP